MRRQDETDDRAHAVGAEALGRILEQRRFVLRTESHVESTGLETIERVRDGVYLVAGALGER